MSDLLECLFCRETSHIRCLTEQAAKHCPNAVPMSEALEAARDKVADMFVKGEVRNMNAPIMAIRDPEPSHHPDERMRMTIKEPKLRDTKSTLTP